MNHSLTYLLSAGLIFSSAVPFSLAEEENESTALTAVIVDKTEAEGASTAAAAQTISEDQKEIQEQNAYSDPDAIRVDDAIDTVEEWADEVLQQFGLDDWGEKNGKYFLYSFKMTAVSELDPQFSSALATAFDEAMTDIQMSMLDMRFGHLVQDKIREFYSDQSTDAKEISLKQPTAEDTDSIPAKMLRNLDKALDVGNAKLDKELEELGVPQEQIQKLNPVEKKLLFKDKLIKSITKKASGQIGGLFPIQTVVVIDKNHNAAVGVAAVFSPKTAQIAKDIAMHRPSLIKGIGKDPSFMKINATDPEQLIGNLGVRLFYDQYGNPAIVSYAIGGFTPDGDDAFINSELKRDARQAAIDAADAQIAEVINGYMASETNRQEGQDVEKYVERELTPDSLTQEHTRKNIIKMVRTFAKSRASIKLQGCSTLQTKLVKLPGGHQMYHVVRIWKYTPPKQAVAPAQQQIPVPAGNGKVYPAKKINVLEDF